MTKYGRAGWRGRDTGTASALVIVACAISLQVGAAAQGVPNEYRLKAAFLHRFSQFVEWPASAWDGTGDVRICVLDPNPFGAELEELVRGERLNGRPISVRGISGPATVSGCHLLFVGANAPAMAEVLKAARTSAVLTVGEGERFLDAGGIIAFRVVERRVRFDVSAAAARRAGLRISSQLLGLALNVRGDSR